jgi:hypothetical protein
MLSYIAEKYAEMLTEDDVANLFELLTSELGGNRSEAARQAGLTGKATYDWAQVAYVKLGTKKKVLDAALKANFAATVEYLLEESNNRNIDLLRTILGTFFADALESNSQESFKAMQSKFNTIRKSHLGLIRDGIQNEVADMEISIKSKAEQLGVLVEAKGAEEFSGKEVLEAIELIGNVYIENPIQAENLAVKDMGLPLETVKPIIATFRNLCSTSKMQTNTIIEPHVKAVQVILSPEIAYANVFKSFAQQSGFLKEQTNKPNLGGNYNEITTRA